MVSLKKTYQGTERVCRGQRRYRIRTQNCCIAVSALSLSQLSSYTANITTSYLFTYILSHLKILSIFLSVIHLYFFLFVHLALH
jgi:hypothetical protein